MSLTAWETRKLDQLGFVGRGKSKHRPRDDSRLYNGPYPFFQTGDVKSADFYLSRYSQTYSVFGLAQSKLWPAGTLCVTIAANIGESAILAIPGCFPDSVVGFIANEAVSDVRFVKYSIDVFKLRMKAISGGATQDNMSLDKLLSFDFPVPPLPIQRRIAAVLSAYDDLIENNRKRISILEEMARRLYREWFVHFRYPGHESVPLVDSPRGLIPQGWELEKLGHVVDLRWGDTNTTKASYTKSGFDAYSASGLDGRLNHYDFDRSGIVLSAIGANCGATWLVRGKWSCIKNTIRYWPTDPRVGIEYLFLATKGSAYWTRRGAAQPFISQGDAHELPMLIPSMETSSIFSLHATPIFEMSANLERQTMVLRRARDLLLPRLMSGQLSVEAAEAAVP